MMHKDFKEGVSMGAGRPSKYEDKFCEMLIEHCSKGLSLESFAGKIQISKDTLFRWFKEHKEFSDSKKIAIEQSRLFWEEQGLEGLWEQDTVLLDEDGRTTARVKKKINSTMWVFNMKNRFGWKDKTEVEIEQKKPFKFAYDKEDAE